MSMKNSLVRLFDTIEILPSCVDQFRATLQDNVWASTGNRVLHVEIAATHAGKLTRNHGFYLPQMMKDAANTFVEPFGKPLLVHHNMHEDPIGRIVSAKYVDTSMQLVKNASNAQILKDLCNPDTSFARYLKLIDDLAESPLLRDPNYQGLGYVSVTVEVTDADAIQKFLDKRYLTVSTGMTTDRAVCSVCKKDWVEDGPCEHIPGKDYDGKLAFLIAGKLQGEELSVVNAPADVYAKVITIQNGTEHDTIVAESLDNYLKTNVLLSTAELSGGQIMAVQDNTQTPPAPPAASEPTPPAPPALPPEQVAQPVKDEVEEETKEEVKDEASDHYDAMIEFGYQLGLFDTGFEDKVLTPEARKGLAKSTFCKPGERKYPVPDCNHARVAMAYAKKNNESSAVVSCIRRKAKALGCPFDGGKDSFDEAEIDRILADLEKNSDKPTSDATKPEVTKEPEKEDKKCKCEETEDALKQEVADLTEELRQSQQTSVDQLSQLKLSLADTLTKLDVISGKNINDTSANVNSLASMSVEDLVKKVTELGSSLKIDEVVKKLNDGMTRIPEGTVTDPTATAQITVDPTNQPNTEDKYLDYKTSYKMIKDAEGLKKAEKFVQQLKQARLVPVDFDPEK